MKKKILFTGLSLVFLLVAIATISHTKVFAARGTGSVCITSDDFNMFPYGFMCGAGNSTNTNFSGAPIDANGFSGAGNGNNGQYRDVVPGTNLTLTGNYHTNGPALQAGKRQATQVLVWATIDIQDVYAGNVSDNSPNSRLSCPGTGNSARGPVFNYQDVNNSARTDSSPVAYDPTNGTGVEDCLSQGRVTYWTNSGTLSGYTYGNYIIGINTTGMTESTKFCVRMNVSVGYDSDQQLFPFGYRSNDYSYYATHDQNVTAAHVAKQSNRLCYNVHNNHPAVSNFTVRCNAQPYYVISGAQDPDHLGQAVDYEIAHINSNGSGITIDATGTTDGAGNAGSNFQYPPAGVQYTIKIRDKDNNLWYTPTGVVLPVTAPNCPPNPGTASCIAYAPATARLGDTPQITVSFENDSTGTDWKVGVFAYTSGGVPQAWDQHSGAQTYPGGIANAFQVLNEDYRPSGGTNLNMLRHGHIESPAIVYTENSPAAPGEVVYTFSIYNDAYAATANPDAGWFNGNKAICSARITWTAPGNPPALWVDDAICHATIDGWAYDPDSSDSQIYVDIYDGAPWAGGTQIWHNLTNVFRGDVNASRGINGIHGFSAAVPSSLEDGNDHTFYIYARDDGSGTPPAGDNGPWVITMTGCGHFTLTPGGSGSLNDSENPTAYNGTTTVTVSYPSWTNPTKPAVSGNDTSIITKVGNPVPITTLSHNPQTYNNQSYPISGPVSSPQAGDKYCMSITVSPGSGIIDRNGNIISTDPPGSNSFTAPCDTIVNRPYAHFLGSDVFSGGGFGDNCTTTGGFINAYTKTTGVQARGSGTQFGAFALQSILGFNSANLRSGAPSASNGLTFANSGVNPSGSGAVYMGGNFGLASHCVTDYFDKMPVATQSAGSNSSTTTSVGANGATYYKPAGGTLTLNGGSIANAVNQAIYVEGNVYITGGNITYAGAGGYGSIANIPSLMVIVKGGNIYVDPSVTQLDGIFIAEPNGGTGGNIYTCAGAGGAYPLTAIFDNCKNRLVVNGAFVASTVYLYRTYSSLRSSVNGENQISSGPHPCGVVGNDVPNTGPASSKDCAAEIFNFSPEVFLSKPFIQSESGPTTSRYDSMTSLPPVL